MVTFKLPLNRLVLKLFSDGFLKHRLSKRLEQQGQMSSTIQMMLEAPSLFQSHQIIAMRKK